MLLASDSSLNAMSPLQKARMEYTPELPEQIQNITHLNPVEGEATRSLAYIEQLQEMFSNVFGQPILSFDQGAPINRKAKKVSVVLSGGQAAGGHNVIAGLFDALKSFHQDSQLFGFLNGPIGLIENKYKELKADELKFYRQQGGFDLIGSGRTKIQTPEQFAKVKETVEKHSLDAVVIIGGDDSNTNAALLAEYFKKNGCNTQVIGVPKTIDADLKNEHIEVSFGFDTAAKTYSELIGNIARDCLSAKKYYHFVKLMGRSASHIALECALQTQVNYTLISEEVSQSQKTLSQITSDIADMISERAKSGKNYGVILIPEGLVEYIPEMKILISELNDLFGKGSELSLRFEKIAQLNERVALVRSQLSSESLSCFDSLPSKIQEELLQDRDDHGNVQVSFIQTEELIASTVEVELEKRKEAGEYSGKFSANKHFFGYEGRAAFPSKFDSTYCHSLGYAAALLIESDKTAYMAAVKNLHLPVKEWQVMGIPLTSMMTLEKRKGEMKPVISKTLVDLGGLPYKTMKSQEEAWKKEDAYLYPGPIQFFGPDEITGISTKTLSLERA